MYDIYKNFFVHYTSINAFKLLNYVLKINVLLNLFLENHLNFMVHIFVHLKVLFVKTCLEEDQKREKDGRLQKNFDFVRETVHLTSCVFHTVI